MVVHKKKEIERDVYELAIERIHRTYDIFDNVVVMFSGGKDSTVCLNLVIDVARERNKLPVEVYFFDEEAIPYETIDYVKRVSDLPEVDMHWMCLPVKHRNGCSRTEPYWYPWGPEDKEKWVRPMPNYDYVYTQEGNTLINGNSQTSITLNIQSGAGMAIDINNGTVWIDDSGEAMFATGTSGQTMSSRFSSADARPKPFDIKHPSREGYRLRYACVEGPEVGVYLRGRVKNEKVIVLPSYWKDFVYIDSISVQLQPIGAHQDVIVKRWDDEKIYLQSRGGMPIDCFYHVYAERNDINSLITEYQGDSHRDYPDPNHHIIPDNERNYKDPEYATKQNIRTK